MSALLAILGRELRLRRNVLLLALALGLASTALTFYGPRGLRATGPGGMALLTAGSVGATGVAMMVGLSMLVIAGLWSGWSTIASEASSGHLGFFFSRPVPWWALWGGKLTAAVGLSFAAASLAILPSWVTDSGRWHGFLSASNTSALLLGIPFDALLVVGFANAASVAHRGQLVRRAFDMTLSAALLYALLRPSRLLTVGAWSLGAETSYAAVQAPLALALLAGSAMQVRGGRMEALRSHALLSLTVWPLVGAGLGILVAIGSLMWGASPPQLRRVTRVEAPARGGWIFVAGPVRWGQYSAAFLYEPSTGRNLSLGSTRGIGRVSFAPDGSLVAISETDMFDPTVHRTRVLWLEGERRGLEKVFDFLPEDVSVSPRGEYLIAMSARARWGSAAGTTYRRLEFYKLPSGALINSVTISAVGISHGRGGFLSPISFQDDGRLRVYVGEEAWHWGRYVRIVTADLPAFLVAGKVGVPILLPTGGFPVGRGTQLTTSSAGDRVLLRSPLRKQYGRSLGIAYGSSRGEGGGPTICVHDGVSGEHLSTLVDKAEMADADFLSDGRIAVVAVEDGHVRVLIVDSEKEDVVGELEEFSAETVVLAGEMGPGCLLLGAHRTGTDFGAAVTLDWGGDRTNRRFHRGLYPAILKPAAGSLASSLLITDQGGLVRYDSKTGTRTVLLGGR